MSRTDQDLERLLRSTFATRGSSVQHAPGWTEVDERDAAVITVRGAGDQPHDRRVSRSPWLRGVAGLAAAVSVVGGVLVIRAVDRSTDTPPTAPDPNPTAPATRTVVRTACITSLPVSWKQLSDHNAFSATGITNPFVAGFTADGSAVLVGASGAVASHPILGILAPGATDVRALLVPPSTPATQIMSVDVDGHSVVAVEGRFVRETTATGPKRTFALAPTRIVLVDTVSARPTVLADASTLPRGQHLVDAAYVQSGSAYWQIHGGGDRLMATDTIHAADVTTGRPRVLVRGRFLQLSRTPAGVSWDTTATTPDRPLDLPATVRASMTDRRGDSLVTDKTAYAWTTSRGDVAWWAPGSPVVLVRGLSDHGSSRILSIAGPLVFLVQASLGNAVLDSRTGALAPVSLAVRRAGVRGELVSTPFGPVGGDLLRMRADRLPPASC